VAASPIESRESGTPAFKDQNLCARATKSIASVAVSAYVR
jgi:hypothetical protein